MTEDPADKPFQKPSLKRRDLLVGIGFSAVNAAAHLVWNPIVDYWQYVVTTVVFVSALTFWLVKEWRRLDLFITRFYCAAVTCRPAYEEIFGSATPYLPRSCSASAFASAFDGRPRMRTT